VSEAKAAVVRERMVAAVRMRMFMMDLVGAN